MMHAPVKVITVEREYGSRGGEFAHDLAERLGWRLLDSELVAGAARMAGVDPKLAAKFDERLDPWYYRYGKVFWHDSGYSMAAVGDDQIFDSERMLALISRRFGRSQTGNCVLVGRGVACALAGRRAAFMCLFTLRPAPSATGLSAFPAQAEHADQHLAAVRQAPRGRYPQFYQQEWCSRGLYHMLLNSCMGTDAMVLGPCRARLDCHRARRRT